METRENQINSSPSLTRMLGKFLLITFVGCLFLGLIVIIGHWSFDYLPVQPTNEIPFKDIECNTPEGISKEDFLNEVRYVSNTPAMINIRSGKLESILRTAFGKHPRVLKISSIVVNPPPSTHSFSGVQTFG